MTGATGFVGARLAASLLADGWEVDALVRPQARVGRLPEGAGTIEHDGTATGLAAALAARPPRVAFHLASLFVSEHRTEQIDDLVASNVLLAAQLAEACVECGARGIVAAGTSWQHFEGVSPRAVNLYAATKQAADDILGWYADAAGLGVVSLHLFDTYGPGDPRRKLVHLLVEAARSGEPLGVSPGEQLIDLVHVDDVVSAFRAAGERVLTGTGGRMETYGVSSGEPRTLREIVALAGDVAGRPLSVEWGARPYRPREVMQPWTPPDALPDWSAQVPLRDGLAQLLSEAERAPGRP